MNDSRGAELARQVDGIELRIDSRLACLAAILAMSSPPYDDEHPLVTRIRDALARFGDHPAAQWTRAAVDRVGLLAVGMRVAQLGRPPEFTPPSDRDVPTVVREQFPQPPFSELAARLSVAWRETELPDVLSAQAADWSKVLDDVAETLRAANLIDFQNRFFGDYRYRPVVVPLASMPRTGVRGMGLPDRGTAIVVCLAWGARSYQTEQWRTLLLAQHESSHPVLNDLERRYPDLPTKCEIVESIHPPTGTFASVYHQPAWRWAETLIRASTYFYFRELGRDDDAESFRYYQGVEGVTGLDTYIAALEPWWELRRTGEGPAFAPSSTSCPDGSGPPCPGAADE